MKKIPKKYAILLTASFMALIMSSLISAVFTLLSSGFTLESLILWTQKTPVAFIIAWPIAVVVLPLVRKGVEKITE